MINKTKFLQFFIIFLLITGLLITNVFAKPLTLVLDWFINPDHAPLFVAQQQGFFKQQGIKVIFIPPAQASDGMKLVAIGKADLAITYQPAFTIQISQGLPLARIGTLISNSMDCMMVLKSSDIYNIKDLKGKRIAYTAGFSNFILKMMLASANLTLKDVKLIAINQNIVQSLLSNQVDAVTGVTPTFEPIEMRLSGHSARLFFPENYGIPSYDGFIIISNKKEINDPRIKRFLIAWKKGVLYLRAHPKKTWLQFAKNHPELNNQLNHDAWFATLPYFNSNPAKFDSQKYHKFAIFLKQQGLIKKIPNFQFL